LDADEVAEPQEQQQRLGQEGEGLDRNDGRKNDGELGPIRHQVPIMGVTAEP
jgi:hypothetical protein